MTMVHLLIMLAAMLQTPRAAPSSPQAAADELLAVDRAFSASIAQTTVSPGLTPMFSPDFIMPSST